jgi:hypothetical protein
MPVTRRSQSKAPSKSNLTDSETKSSASSPIIVDDVTDSDFQPLPKYDRAMSVMTRRSRALKRTITEIDSSDVESIKEESTSTTQSLALPTGRRKKGKEKASDALTISSSGPMEPEYTPATSVSDDFGTIKKDSDEDADQDEDIVLIDDDDDETDEPFEIESGSETNAVSSSGEESSTPIWSRTSRQGGRRRIPTRSTAIEPAELQALDSDTSIEESDAPLRGRTRSEGPAPAANARTRNRRNRQQRPPRKSWVSPFPHVISVDFSTKQC